MEFIAAYRADHGLYTIDTKLCARYMNWALSARLGSLYKIIELGRGKDLQEAQVLIAKHHLLGDARPV